jgi:ribosomal protein S18 acetylase RimI-like enzyme
VTAELGDDIPAILDLEHAASEPYTRFVFSTAEQAQSLRQYLFDRSLAEFSPPYLRVLREDGRVAGILAVLTGKELATSRLRAALALSKSGLLQSDAAVGRRLQLAGQTLLKPLPNDFYISRIAVAPAERGRGYGQHLMHAAEAEARERGCGRLVLEVAPESRSAIQLYRRAGLLQVDAREVEDPASGRRLEYLHLAKSLEH